ncbi:unnamed protein product [Dicrocoelium dendriticum]|nr:unnamed protein product [Dicrocoelium dendriticum]
MSQSFQCLLIKLFIFDVLTRFIETTTAYKYEAIQTQTTVSAKQSAQVMENICYVDFLPLISDLVECICEFYQ